LTLTRAGSHTKESKVSTTPPVLTSTPKFCTAHNTAAQHSTGHAQQQHRSRTAQNRLRTATTQQQQHSNSTTRCQNSNSCFVCRTTHAVVHSTHPPSPQPPPPCRSRLPARASAAAC
jgi:hypothetical protein